MSRTAPLPPVLAGDAIEWAAQRLARARLCYGHGTDNPRDEAAALVFHAAGWPHSAAPAAYRQPLPRTARSTLARLVATRIEERVPAAYLTGVSWFAGHEIRVDRRVLVPRSPIAELIAQQFQPFVEVERVTRILDMGTGSGCIAIACAHAFPRARVDAVDVSRGALVVARDNVRRHGLEKRVRPVQSNVYARLGARRYDIIVSNPPYVPRRDVDRLPPEYRHEPRVGLDAGPDGLDAVRTILAGAARRLEAEGVLIVEVGDSAAAVERAWPRVPFLWLDFQHGGGGVFLLRRAELVDFARRALRAARQTR
jgi:ribosomal protein L3 glutamine methyltransferase